MVAARERRDFCKTKPNYQRPEGPHLQDLAIVKTDPALHSRRSSSRDKYRTGTNAGQF